MLWRRSAAAAPRSSDGPPIRGDSRIQLAWMVVTTATVLFLAGFGTYELLQSGAGGGQGPNAAFQPAGHAKAMDVQVIAQQWEFTYRYPTYGGVEVPHLVLPADTLIRLHVTSLDAIHSFWAYQLGVKADANPGVDNVAYVDDEGPAHVRHPLRRALRALARLHVRHGPGRRASDVRDLDQAAAGVLRARRASTCRRTRRAISPTRKRAG